jgi:hypothetical protein
MSCVEAKYELQLKLQLREGEKRVGSPPHAAPRQNNHGNLLPNSARFSSSPSGRFSSIDYRTPTGALDYYGLIAVIPFAHNPEDRIALHKFLIRELRPSENTLDKEG